MRTKVFIAASVMGIIWACGGSAEKEVSSSANAISNEQTEPVTEETSPADNQNVGTSLAETGKSVFEKKCISCHAVNQKVIGPALAGVTQRRSTEWIKKMITHPEQMLQEDETARALLKEYNNIPMTNQQVTEEEANALIEFLKTI